MKDKSTSDASFESRLWGRVAGSSSLVAKLARIIATVVRGAIVDRIWLRAGNMTYLSLLYMVPVGALALSLSSRLGWKSILSRWIEERLSPTAPELAANIVAAMDRLDVVAIGYIGLAAIIIAGVIALSELEGDFCEILNARNGRKWWQRVLLYPFTIAVAPTIVAVVLAIGAIAEARTTLWIGNLQNWGSVGRWVYNWLIDLPLVFQLTPYVLTWFLLTACYYLVTSAPVRLQSAVIGGLSAGIVWQLAQKLYINFQFGSSTYKEIWGYLAQIPLLLIWLYASWVILFLGAEVVFAWQHRHAYLPKWPMASRIPAGIETQAVIETAAEVLRSVGLDVQGVSAATISMRQRIPWPFIARIAHDLAAAGLLHERRKSRGYLYTPSKRLSQMTVRQLIEIYRSQAETSSALPGERPHDLSATLGRMAGVED